MVSHSEIQKPRPDRILKSSLGFIEASILDVMLCVCYVMYQNKL